MTLARWISREGITLFVSLNISKFSSFSRENKDSTFLLVGEGGRGTLPIILKRAAVNLRLTLQPTEPVIHRPSQAEAAQSLKLKGLHCTQEGIHTFLYIKELYDFGTFTVVVKEPENP